MKTLEVYSEIVSWSILLFIFLRVLGTQCFGKVDWILTLMGVLFSYFIRYVNKIEGE